MVIESHADLLKSIFKVKNSMIFHIDEGKNSKITETAIVQFVNVETKTKH